MNDINLFDRLKPKPKKTNYSRLLVFLFLALLICFIIYNEFSFYNKKNQLGLEINSLRRFSTSDEMNKKISEINDKEEKIKELIAINKKLTLIDSFMESNNIVHDGLLTSISTSVPKNCFLNNINISEKNINLNGYADSYESVAEFEHRLRSTRKLGPLFNPFISEENANYSFSFVAQVLGGVKDEDK